MVLYEYPFNEDARTLLRLEHLFERLGTLVQRDAPIDHHYALVTLFEIMDVAGRSDLKTELLKDLDRQKHQLLAYRDDPRIEPAALQNAVDRLEAVFSTLNEQTGKAGSALTANDWLMALRGRIAIPGGTCEFDLPAYHAWQQRPPQQRRDELLGWIQELAPLGHALQLLLSIVRETGAPQRHIAVKGVFEQRMPSGRHFQLLRVWIPTQPELVPEITGHRLLTSVRLHTPEPDGKLRPYIEDTPLDIALCL